MEEAPAFATIANVSSVEGSNQITAADGEGRGTERSEAWDGRKSKDMKSSVHNVRDRVAHVEDRGTISQPRGEVILGGGSDGEDKEMGKIAQIPVLQTVKQGASVHGAHEHDNASESPVKHGATSSMEEGSGTDAASVERHVHKPVRLPTLPMPSALAPDTEQRSPNTNSKPAFNFSPLPQQAFGSSRFRIPVTLPKTSESVEGNAILGLLPVPQSVSGLSNPGAKFTPYQSVFASTKSLESGLFSTPQLMSFSNISGGSAFQSSPFVASNGVLIQVSKARSASTSALTQSRPLNPLHREWHIEEEADLQRIPQSFHPLSSSAASNLMSPWDRISVPIVKIEEVENASFVSGDKGTFTAAGAHQVQHQPHGHGVQHMHRLQGRIESAESWRVQSGANMFAEAPTSAKLSTQDSTQLNIMHTKTYDATYGGQPVKRHKGNMFDKGKGQNRINHRYPLRNNAQIEKSIRAKGKEPTIRFPGASFDWNELPVHEAAESSATYAVIDGRVSKSLQGPRTVDLSSVYVPPHRRPPPSTVSEPSNTMGRQPTEYMPRPSLPAALGFPNAMSIQPVPAQSATAPSLLAIQPQSNELHQRPPPALTPVLSSATDRRPALAHFVPGPSEQQAPSASRFVASPVPRKLTVLTLPYLGINTSLESIRMASDVMNEANSLLSLYTDVQLAFSARDMGCKPFHPN